MNDNFDEILESLEKKLNDLIKTYKRFESIKSDIVKLNVGGSLFSTLKSTLTKQIKDENGNLFTPNMFESLINGFVKPKYDENKAIFIDRDPKYFSHILNYLRMANTGTEYEVPDGVDLKELNKEAQFYNIQGLERLTRPRIHETKMDSVILNEKQVEELINLCQFPQESRFKLLYRASRDGFESKNFHQKCDNIPKTLSIFKSKDNRIFGGFTEQTWEGFDIYKSDPNAFVFSFVDPKEKLVVNNPSKSIYCSKNLGPNFGTVDIYLPIEPFKGSSVCFGTTYGSNASRNFPYEIINFLPDEIEVYKQF